MTEKEMRELDAWIAENVFGETVESGAVYSKDFTKDEMGFCLTGIAYPVPNYTTDPAAAMTVLEKCAEKDPTISIQKCQNGWRAFSINAHALDCDTLPLAIAKLARKLFENKS